MRVRFWLALAVIAGISGCSDDPSGPGSYQGLVRSSTVVPGAVILELSGIGIESVGGVGGSQAFSARTSVSEGGSETFRVVLIREGAGEIGFSVDVLDLAQPRPRAVVINAVHGNNLPVGDVTSFSVDVAR